MFAYNSSGEIDNFVEAQMRELHIPSLALAIVQGDQIMHLKGYGGLVFQYRMNSHMVGGVDQDAKYLGEVIAERLQVNARNEEPRIIKTKLR